MRAMTRRPDSYAGAGKPVAGVVHDPASLADAASTRAVHNLLPTKPDAPVTSTFIS